ncbi:MAG TPA: cytochrome c oxidase assembly protein [Longimicrobiaceae bacterium]|nr:cytochrome c oxidase assembly protein [Longimicrobiaceae bacterium]
MHVNRPGFVRWVVLALALRAGPAWAHTGRPPAPHDVWSAWSWEPGVLLGLGLSAWLYARGVERLWRRAGVGRGIRRWQAGCFAAGLATLFLALVSPLDALGSALFSAHMAQHELLILVAAPLLVLGAPLIPFVWALPPRWRGRAGGVGRLPAVRAAWGALTHPLTAWSLHAAAVWTWHAPALYQRTLVSEPAHVAQHASFLGTALLFWWVLLHPGRRGALGHGIGVLYVFTTAVYGSVLGALLTFAPAPWYPAYAPSVGAWGLSLLEDQQLGGLVMWVPFGLVYLGAALALFAAWLRAIEREVRRAEASASPRSPSASPLRTG